MADIISSGDKEKSIYLKQIRYLDEKLERCQLKCDELAKQNKSLIYQYNTLEMDKKDMAEYLKREKKVEEVLEQLESQQKVAKQDKEAQKMQLLDQINELNSQSMMQDLKFEAQEQLMESLKEQHEAAINSQKEQHEAAINSLKEQHEAAINSLKEQHEASINSLKEDAVFDRANIMEEAQKNMEIFLKEGNSEVPKKDRAQHSEKMERLQFLLKENMVLWEDINALCKRLRQDEEKLNKVTQESLSRMKEVEQLRTRCQQLTVKLNNCIITRKVRQQTLAKKEADLAKKRQHLSEQCRQKTAEADQLEAELQKERSRRRQLEAVMQEAVIILRHIMMESEKMAKTEWMMQRLLEILESSAPQGTGTVFDDATEKRVGGQGPWTSGLKPPRAKTLNLSTDPMFLMARYRPGDLGFIPRPRWKLKPAAAQSSSNRLLPLNRKLPSQKTSSPVDLSDPTAPAAQQEDSAAEASTSADCSPKSSQQSDESF